MVGYGLGQNGMNLMELGTGAFIGVLGRRS